MTMAEVDEVRDAQGLIFKISNSRPVALDDLTASLGAFSRAYNDFVGDSDPEASGTGVKLYVQELRTGSVLAVFQAIADQGHLWLGTEGVIQSLRYLFDHADTLAAFAANLSDSVGFFAGEKELSGEPPTKRQATDLIDILEPVAKEAGSSISIRANNINIGTINININHMKANAVQNAAKRFIGPSTPANRILKDEVLVLHQVRGDAGSKVGDKGIIEAISKLPVKLFHASESIKKLILDLAENPFQLAFIVDVDVKTVDNKPALYKILELKDKFERPA